MKRQELRIGMRVRLSDQEYLIEQRLPDGQVLLKPVPGGTLSTRSEHEIAKAMSRANVEVLGSPRESDKARYGRRVADLRKRTNEAAITPSRRLDRTQIDHTRLDLVVIDTKMSVPIDHPWLEIYICPFTRMILAFKAIHRSLANQN